MKNIGVNTNKAPSLFKLGACFIYDTLIVIALSFVCAGVFILLIGDATQGGKRYLLQLLLWSFIGVYFLWCWTKSGQTLAMKTWKLKVIDRNGGLLSPKVAFARYVLATLGLVFFGLGFLWALIDADHLYLHDRVLKSRISAE